MKNDILNQVADLLAGPHSPFQNPAYLLPAAIFAALLWMEAIRPHRTAPPGQARRLLGNVSLGALYRLLLTPLLLTPIAVYTLSQTAWHLERPAWCEGVLVVLVDFVLLDLMNYVTHVMAHQIPLLWRFHAIHHLDIHLDSSTGLRQHFGEKAFVFLLHLPCILLAGIPPATLATFSAVSLSFGIFHHANIKLPGRLERLIGWMIVLPNFHRVHHNRLNPYTDSNYGFVLSIWDRLFRTTRAGCSTRVPDFAFGLDHHGPMSLSKLLLAPLSRKPVHLWS